MTDNGHDRFPESSNLCNVLPSFKLTLRSQLMPGGWMAVTPALVTIVAALYSGFRASSGQPNLKFALDSTATLIKHMVAAR
jgi:hypothetical protein